MKRETYSGIRYLFLIFFTLAIISITNSCTKDSLTDPNEITGNPDMQQPGPNEVWIQGSAFTPSTITVTAGTSITWTNKEGTIHTVTSDTGLFDSGNIGNKGTFSFKFNAAGTFFYHCTTHPSMKANVTVI